MQPNQTITVSTVPSHPCSPSLFQFQPVKSASPRYIALDLRRNALASISTAEQTCLQQASSHYYICKEMEDRLHYTFQFDMGPAPSLRIQSEYTADTSSGNQDSMCMAQTLWLNKASRCSRSTAEQEATLNTYTHNGIKHMLLG